MSSAQNVSSNKQVSNQHQHDPEVDRLLSMVDTSASTPGVLPERSICPAIASLDTCITAWRAVQASTGLKKIGNIAKYSAVFVTFTDKFKADMSTDGRGQYLRIGPSQKLRPVDGHGRAHFYGAVSYLLE